MATGHLVGVLGDVGALGVEALVGVGGVVDDLELAISVKESVPSLHVAFAVALLITELTVVAEKQYLIIHLIGYCDKFLKLVNVSTKFVTYLFFVLLVTRNRTNANKQFSNDYFSFFFLLYISSHKLVYYKDVKALIFTKSII